MVADSTTAVDTPPLHDSSPTLEEEMFERRKGVIQSTWRAVRFGLDVKATQMFYDRLFDQFPFVRSMFPDNMKAQYSKLFKAVSLVVECLDDVEALVPVLKDLGVRHAGYGVVRSHYEAVTECFLWTLNTYIFAMMPNNNAVTWVLDIADSWDWALTFIGTIMADAADEAMEARRIRLEEKKRSFGSLKELEEQKTTSS
jgi:hemoglobin-like flavoprotein